VEVPNVSWEDIGGLDNVKRELQEVCTSSHLEFHSPPFFPNAAAGGGSVETCCIHMRFHFCVPILITSFWLLADCPIPSGAP
jgi:hypothetical protein